MQMLRRPSAENNVWTSTKFLTNKNDRTQRVAVVNHPAGHRKYKTPWPRKLSSPPIHPHPMPNPISVFRCVYHTQQVKLKSVSQPSRSTRPKASLRAT